MPEALEHMAERTTSRDLRYFVSAINIQHEVGGNLAEVMENIGSLIRDRLNLKAKVRGFDQPSALICHHCSPFCLLCYFFWFINSILIMPAFC